jgi:surfeit locus 1 family protein
LKNKLFFSLFVYFFILIFLSLGFWQIIRLNWKLELINSINTSLKSDPVTFNGYDPKNFLKIKFDGTLNRGWIPRDQKNNDFSISSKKFSGILKLKSKFNYFKPENDIQENYWFTLKDEDLTKFTGLSFSPYIIFEINESNDSFPIPKNIEANLSNNHLKYSLTWFSLAISIFLIYLYFRKKNY